MPGEGAPPEIETEQRTLEIAGEEWTVRAVGRARVRSGASGTPLIEIVYRSSGGEERESLVVGRTLADLPDATLAETLRHSRPYRPDREPAPFFDGTRQSGGRGRG